MSSMRNRTMMASSPSSAPPLRPLLQPRPLQPPLKPNSTSSSLRSESARRWYAMNSVEARSEHHFVILLDFSACTHSPAYSLCTGILLLCFSGL